MKHNNTKQAGAAQTHLSHSREILLLVSIGIDDTMSGPGFLFEGV